MSFLSAFEEEQNKTRHNASISVMCPHLTWSVNSCNSSDRGITTDTRFNKKEQNVAIDSKFKPQTLGLNQSKLAISHDSLLNNSPTLRSENFSSVSHSVRKLVSDNVFLGISNYMYAK